MPPGENSSILSISGITYDAHKVIIPVSCAANLRTYALLMNISLFDSMSTVDLKKPVTHASCPEGAVGFADGYTILKEGRILNTGNVPIALFYFLHDVAQIPNKIIFPGDTAFISKSSISSIENGIFIKLDGHNTTTDPSLLQMGNDGSAYIWLTAATS
jgi:hypothetical protein